MVLVITPMIIRRIAEQAGHPTVREQTEALELISEPFWSPFDAERIARFILPNLRGADRYTQVVCIRKLADQIARLECGGGPFDEFTARLPGEAHDVHCDRQAVEAKVLYAAAMKAAIDADWQGRRR